MMASVGGENHFKKRLHKAEISSGKMMYGKDPL